MSNNDTEQPEGSNADGELGAGSAAYADLARAQTEELPIVSRPIYLVSPGNPDGNKIHIRPDEKDRIRVPVTDAEKALERDFFTMVERLDLHNDGGYNEARRQYADLSREARRAAGPLSTVLYEAGDGDANFGLLQDMLLNHYLGPYYRDKQIRAHRADSYARDPTSGQRDRDETVYRLGPQDQINIIRYQAEDGAVKRAIVVEALRATRE